MAAPPLIVCLDTRDHIRLFNRYAGEDVRRTLAGLSGFRDRGDIVIGFSGVNILEFIGKRDADPLLPVLTCPWHGWPEVLVLERDGKMGDCLDGPRNAGVSRLEVIEGPSGRRRRTKAERARMAAESMMAGVKVTDVARKHGTTGWQISDWRRQMRKGNPVVPESVAVLPMFPEVVVADSAAPALPPGGRSNLEIIVGDVVIRAGTDADEGRLTRAIRAARAAAT